MNSKKLLEEISGSMSSTKFDDSELQSLTKKQLSKLATVHGEPTDPDLVHLWKKYLDGVDYTDASMYRLFVCNYARRREESSILHAAQLEETTIQKGWDLTYGPTEIKAAAPSGAVTVIKNTAFPSDCKTRPFSDPLVGAIATLLRVSPDGAQRGHPVPTTLLNKELGAAFSHPKSAVDLARSAPFISAAVKVISNSHQWSVLSNEKRRVLQGKKWIDFVQRVVNAVPWEVYFCLHTLYVAFVLRAYNCATAKGRIVVRRRIIVNNQPAVPDACFSCSTHGIPAEWGLTEEILEAASETFERFGFIAMFYGGAPSYQSMQMVSAKTIKFADAQKAVTVGAAIRGGSKGPLDIISSGEGFSGLPSKACRKMMLAISLSLSALNHVKDVDLLFNDELSPSYLGVILQSFCDCEGYIRSVGGSIRAVVPHKAYPVNEDHRALCTTARRQDALLVQFHSLKPISKIAEADDLEDALIETLPQAYISVGPVYGEVLFGTCEVYRYGYPSGFDSIITSLEKPLVLVGFPQRNGEKWNAPEIPMREIPSLSEFYVDVLKVNLRKNAYFLNPSPHFSLISALLRPTKGGPSWDEKDDWAETPVFGSTDSWGSKIFRESVVEQDDEDPDGSQSTMDGSERTEGDSGGDDDRESASEIDDDEFERRVRASIARDQEKAEKLKKRMSTTSNSTTTTTKRKVRREKEESDEDQESVASPKDKVKEGGATSAPVKKSEKKVREEDENPDADFPTGGLARKLQ